jgi:hypothetical protein
VSNLHIHTHPHDCDIAYGFISGEAVTAAAAAAKSERVEHDNLGGEIYGPLSILWLL